MRRVRFRHSSTSFLFASALPGLLWGMWLLTTLFADFATCSAGAEETEVQLTIERLDEWCTRRGVGGICLFILGQPDSATWLCCPTPSFSVRRMRHLLGRDKVDLDQTCSQTGIILGLSQASWLLTLPVFMTMAARSRDSKGTIAYLSRSTRETTCGHVPSLREKRTRVNP